MVWLCLAVSTERSGNTATGGRPCPGRTCVTVVRRSSRCCLVAGLGVRMAHCGLRPLACDLIVVIGNCTLVFVIGD